MYKLLPRHKISDVLPPSFIQRRSNIFYRDQGELNCRNLQPQTPQNPLVSHADRNSLHGCMQKHSTLAQRRNARDRARPLPRF